METREELYPRWLAEVEAFCKKHKMTEEQLLRHETLRANTHLIKRLRKRENVNVKSIERLGQTMRFIDPKWMWPPKGMRA